MNLSFGQVNIPKVAMPKLSVDQLKEKLPHKPTVADPSKAFGSAVQTEEELARQSYSLTGQPLVTPKTKQGIGDVFNNVKSKFTKTEEQVFAQQEYQEPAPQEPSQPTMAEAYAKFASTAYSIPNYQTTGYNQGYYQQPIYPQQPQYQQPTYQQPVYPQYQQQPVYQQQPTYQQAPVYQEQPAYQEQPVHQQAPASQQQPTYQQAPPDYSQYIQTNLQFEQNFYEPQYNRSARYQPKKKTKISKEDLPYTLWSGGIILGCFLTVFSFIYACAI